LKYLKDDIPEQMKPPKAGQTQDEVLGIDLVKLALRPDDCVLDIGCGSGKVAIAMAARVSGVSAVDRNGEAIAYARDRARKAERGNITFYHQEAVDFLAGASRFDCAFVGGSGRLAEVLALLADRVDRTIVVNAVLLATLQTAVTEMQRLGIFREALQVQVSRSYPIAGNFMWKPADPVYIIVGGRMTCS
jgi:cobalt-precorrin-6B (C15)-methyltransferase